ncbi:DUF1214 domain-containing protein [Hansschlegelia quercus]|uniref:DUF1214 domain-containing protein n=1 Tax=Hansschlegelia quercus TaxID=2528245 RepID=A0A4Q9GBJ3_9HYPH|nr:DUF1214 domain-containing protein [Hansschlegelia quercus]TBN48641.1 DUF1214 domain-containing protein [Hansschlegelia quercus]
MRLVLWVLAVFALAASIGLGATWWTVANGLPATGLVIGPWRSEPDVGTLSADPYERAGAARRGEAPLSIGDGLAFMAATDDEGRPLEAACDYALEGALPPARLWTIAAFDPQGRRLSKPGEEPALTSANAARTVGAPLALTLSREPAPGNWMQLHGAGAFRLRLTFYDTALGSALQREIPGVLLSIKRGLCR